MKDQLLLMHQVSFLLNADAVQGKSKLALVSPHGLPKEGQTTSEIPASVFYNSSVSNCHAMQE